MAPFIPGHQPLLRPVGETNLWSWKRFLSLRHSEGDTYVILEIARKKLLIFVLLRTKTRSRIKRFSPENLIRQKERKSPRRRGDLIKDKRKCRPGGQRAAQQNPYMRNNPSPVNGISDLRLKMDQEFSVITTFCHRSLKVKVSLDDEDEVKNL